MSWDQTRGISCDTPLCQGRIDSPGSPKVMVIAVARSKGWRIFDGRSLTDKAISSHICPDCGGTNRSRLPAPPERLDEDEPLF